MVYFAFPVITSHYSSFRFAIICESEFNVEETRSVLFTDTTWGILMKYVYVYIYISCCFLFFSFLFSFLFSTGST